MKFNVNSYHFKLLRDYERLAVFKEAIEDYAKGKVFRMNEGESSEDYLNRMIEAE